MTPPLKGKGPGSSQDAQGTLEAVVAVLDTNTRGKKKKVSRIKRSKKETFMLSCKGHLIALYHRLDEEFDKSLSDGEEDAEVDTASDGDHSTTSSTRLDRVKGRHQCEQYGAQRNKRPHESKMRSNPRMSCLRKPSRPLRVRSSMNIRCRPHPG